MGSSAGEAKEEFLRIMGQDSDSEEALKNAFQVLNKAQTVHGQLHTDLFCSFMKNRGVELTLGEVEETVRQVTSIRTEDIGNINYEQFTEIIRILKNPSVMDQLKRIYEALGRLDAKPLVLYGEQGVGKTWMARKVADCAIRQKKFDVALWIYLNRIYSLSSLVESIERQLSIPSNLDEPQAKAQEPIHLDLKNKRLLLILDDEGSKMELRAQLDTEKLILISNKEVSETEPPTLSLYQTLAFDQLESFDFLITKRKGPTSGEFGMRVMPFTHDEAKSFVKDQNLKDLADFFIGESRKFPSEVLLISKTLSYFG